MGKGITVGIETLRIGTRDTDVQEVIILRKDGTTNTLEVIKLVPKGEMYAHGLEKNYVKLVDMQEISLSLQTILQGLISVSKFTEIEWDFVYEAFRPFIDRRLKFERVVEFTGKKPDTREDWE